MTGRFRFATVVTTQPICQLLARTNIASVRFLTSENVDMKQIGVTGFEPATCRRGDRSADGFNHCLLIGVTGFEPATCHRGDRSADRFNHCLLIGVTGFEPATCRRGDRSADRFNHCLLNRGDRI